ncbi:hypothetical protein LWI29_011291 [Acer saccharum]|uniref:Pentatricopeptide repeat-containing protein n=1 Tax=Acer saccharum TaxID=4024 RepID=A0AA39RLQ4_ACESA|nr:hypothetical protein LWI29_011291 [Acer saccharum]
MLLQKTKPPNFKFRSTSIDFFNLSLPSKTPTKCFTELPPTTTPQHSHLRDDSNRLSLDSSTCVKLIQNATKSGSVIHGKLLHAHLIKTSFKPCLFLLNNLLNLYCKFGEIRLAYQLFDKMTERNVVSYNLLVSGYTQVGFYDKALNVFNDARMGGQKLDKFTYAGVINVCAKTEDLEMGKLIHGLVVVGGLGGRVFVTNSLIDMYCKCGKIDQARLLFEKSDELDNVSWNSLISGYVRIGANEEIFRILVKMHRNGLDLTTYTMGCVLRACGTDFDDSVIYGRILHGCTLKLGLDLDIVVGTALLDMYAKTGNLDDAISVFYFIPDKNIVMYNAMIAGLIQTDTVSDDCANRAFNLFFEMQRQGMKPSKFTFSSLLKACNAVEAFEYGKQIHAQVCKNDLQFDEFIGSALIELYSLLGSTEDGLKCFNLIPKLDVVSWTSMIKGHIQNGHFESAVALFQELLASVGKTDEFIISTMLAACADLATGRSGEQVQGYGIKSGTGNSTIVQNSQICMYAKSGDIDSANMTFEEMKDPDVASWSAIICSNAQHGCAGDALKLFELMKDLGIAPNQITFLGVLTACSHGGLVQEGLRYFTSMHKDHGITSDVKHYACVVDILARAGRLADAQNFILNSGLEDSPVMWRSLLSACRVYKDTVTAKHAAEKVIELEPQEAASYVLLNNIYVDAGIELPASEVRELMKDRGIKKEPGLSWIEVGNKIHSFVVGDRSHPMSHIIYESLETILEKIKKISYVDDEIYCQYY